MLFIRPKEPLVLKRAVNKRKPYGACMECFGVVFFVFPNYVQVSEINTALQERSGVPTALLCWWPCGEVGCHSHRRCGVPENVPCG